VPVSLNLPALAGLKKRFPFGKRSINIAQRQWFVLII